MSTSDSWDINKHTVMQKINFKTAASRKYNI